MTNYLKQFNFSLSVNNALIASRRMDVFEVIVVWHVQCSSVTRAVLISCDPANAFLCTENEVAGKH